MHLLPSPLPPFAEPGPSPSAAPAPPPTCWAEPGGPHYFSNLATAAATCPAASPADMPGGGSGTTSSSASSSSATSGPAVPRSAEGPLGARSRSNSAEHLLEAVGGTEEPTEPAPGRARAVENQYSFY